MTSLPIAAAVVAAAVAASAAIWRIGKSLAPNSSARPIQIRSSGNICHLGNKTMATMQISQSSNHTISGCMLAAKGWSRCEPVALTTHRLYQSEPELRPQPPDADVDDVRTRIKVDAPDRRQELALGHRVAPLFHEGSQAQELEPGQRNRPGTAIRDQPSRVQAELAYLHDLAAHGVL